MTHRHYFILPMVGEDKQPVFAIYRAYRRLELSSARFISEHRTMDEALAHMQRNVEHDKEDHERSRVT